MKRLEYLFIAGTALATCCAVAAQAATITNGSFEGGPPNFNSYNVNVGDSTSIMGWTVVDTNNSTTGSGKGVAYLGNGAYDITTPFGTNYIDLTSYAGGDSNNSGVSQTVATAIGGVYTLSFYLGQYDGNAPVTAMVYAGSQSSLITDLNASTAGIVSGQMRWTLQNYNFTATSTSTMLSIIGGSSTTSFIGLDNVSISGGPVTPPMTGSVPEPASWAMMIAGFGAIGFAMRRRRDASVAFA